MSGMTDLFGDKWLSGRPIFKGDLNNSESSDAMYPGAKANRWRMLEYDSAGVSGVMIRADVETGAPDLTYRLGAKGWHAISIGVMPEDGKRVEVLARLTGDDTFSILATPQIERGDRHSIQEMFLRVADLTGKDIVFSQPGVQVGSGDGPGSRLGRYVRIAYVKLVPLSESELATYRADAARSDTGRLYGHNDAHGLHYDERPTDPEGIQRHIEFFRNSDFSRLYWECGMGDLLYYLGKAGRLPTLEGLDDFAHQGDRLHRESWQALQRKGIDPFRVALEHARDMEMEFHASYRPAGFKFPPDHDHFDYGDAFYDRHPELRGRDRDGNATPRISYAYPETRKYAVSLLREVAANYDVDGVSLLYNRRPPFSEYEAPMVEGFIAEHGKDPRQLDDEDPSWLMYRCGVLTQFMREVREAMDDEARRQGRRRIVVSAIVMRDAAENLYYGMDLKTWVSEGLVDTLIPYTSAVFLDSSAHSWEDPHGADYFVGLTKGTSTELAMSLLPRYMSAETYRERAAGLYGVGVEKFFFWDCTPGRGSYADSWSALRRLGHKDEVTAWVAAGKPRITPPMAPLKSLDGWNLSYATPG